MQQRGQLLLSRQIRLGTRPILEEIDALRTAFGNGDVTVLTPKAESRLRSGELASVPIQVRVVIPIPDGSKEGEEEVEIEARGVNVALVLQFNRGYPEEPLEVQEIIIVSSDISNRNNNNSSSNNSNNNNSSSDISNSSNSSADVTEINSSSNSNSNSNEELESSKYTEELKTSVTDASAAFLKSLQESLLEEAENEAPSVYIPVYQSVLLVRHLSGHLLNPFGDKNNRRVEESSGLEGGGSSVFSFKEGAVGCEDKESSDNSSKVVGSLVDEVSAISLQSSASGGGAANVTTAANTEKVRLKIIAKCKLCRHIVLEDPILDIHSHAHNYERNFPITKCTSLFLESLPKSVKDFSETGGKITCENCGSRLGQWSWLGVACSCREWITPGIQINISKVDISKM